MTGKPPSELGDSSAPITTTGQAPGPQRPAPGGGAVFLPTHERRAHCFFQDGGTSARGGRSCHLLTTRQNSLFHLKNKKHFAKLLPVSKRLSAEVLTCPPGTTCGNISSSPALKYKGTTIRIHGFSSAYLSRKKGNNSNSGQYVCLRLTAALTNGNRAW